MAARRYVAAGAIASTLASGALIAAPTTAAAGGTGKAILHLVEPGGKPVPNFTLCPTKKQGPDFGKKEGGCGTSNKHGYLTMKHVAAGKWYITYFVDKVAQGSFPDKLKITAGKTTKKKLTVAG